ncbi:hypothetical protein [Paraburkholderia atlantica]|uniref:hypothetical protein n=1 Tax=Paraburkholderia atlantica TaxID=2654982 RepID=UPI003D2510EC
MPRSVRDKDHSSVHDARVLQAVRIAAVAAILFDVTATQALLELPDAELGRLFKIRLMQIAGLSTALKLDLPSIRDEGGRQRSHSNRGSKRRTSASEHLDASVPNAARHPLVAEGRLLRAVDFCKALGITEQRLSKDGATGRIFSVDLEAAPYYPAFFLANEINRNDLAKVVRKLGDLSGWRKWDFFTKPNGALGKLTPLQALMHGEVKQTLRAAEGFLEM